MQGRQSTGAAPPTDPPIESLRRCRLFDAMNSQPDPLRSLDGPARHPDHDNSQLPHREPLRLPSRITLASPSGSGSGGNGHRFPMAKWWAEVTKPETINYRTLKPEDGPGMFCEKILFGPSKTAECHLRQVSGLRHRGIALQSACGVEVTRKPGCAGTAFGNFITSWRLRCPMSVLQGIPSMWRLPGWTMPACGRDVEQIALLQLLWVLD